jgi:uncharacterized Zn-binding protein involved in type VI secretion
MAQGIARVATDIADNSAIQSGATSVISNGFVTAHEGSITSSGDSIVAASTTVFVEDKPVARDGDQTNGGNAVGSGSDNIIIGS